MAERRAAAMECRRGHEGERAAGRGETSLVEGEPLRNIMGAYCDNCVDMQGDTGGGGVSAGAQ